MAYNAKTGQWVPDEKPGDFPTYGAPVQSNPSQEDQRLQSLTDAGWIGSVNAEGKTVGDLAAYQAKKSPQAVISSQSAKTDLSKIQTDFQSILAGLQNKQNYNQAGLDVTNSVVDLMKSKGIADTSAAARQQLAQQAGISDYNPSNAESNKKLAEAIMNSKAVGSEMSKLAPGTAAYDTALNKVSQTVAKSNPAAQAPVQAEALTSTGTRVSEDPMQAEYDKITVQIDNNNNAITSSLNQLRNGAIPLTADQEAVVNATQQSFNNAIAQQKQANQAQENIVSRDAFRGGSEYTPAVSSSIIKNVIDANVLKISEYDQKAIASVAQLKADFKAANYKAIKEGYDSLQKTLKDKQDNMLALMKLSHDYEKESLNYNLDVLKYEETVRKNKADEGIASQKAANSVGLSDPQKVSVFNRIVDKANASPLIAAADRVPVLKASIQNITKDPSNAAQQLNLSYAYIQALDTYQSAVREGELGLVNSIDSKIGALSNSITQIQNGQIVRPEVALQIAGAAKSLVDTIEAASKAKMQSFQQQASVSGVGNEFNQYLGGVSQSYGNQQSTATGGKLDVAAIKSQMEAEGRSSDDIFRALKDANEYNKSLGSVGGDTKQASNKVVAGYDIGSYATDPQHEAKVASIYQKIPTISTPNDANVYIAKVAPNSPVTGQALISAARQYGVDPKMMLALMIQDSTLGTKGLAVKTRNPGNVGNTDSGATKTFKSWDEGVMAVAKNLSWRKVA